MKTIKLHLGRILVKLGYKLYPDINSGIKSLAWTDQRGKPPFVAITMDSGWQAAGYVIPDLDHPELAVR